MTKIVLAAALALTVAAPAMAAMKMEHKPAMKHHVVAHHKMVAHKKWAHKKWAHKKWAAHKKWTHKVTRKGAAAPRK